MKIYFYRPPTKLWEINVFTNLLQIYWFWTNDFCRLFFFCCHNILPFFLSEIFIIIKFCLLCHIAEKKLFALCCWHLLLICNLVCFNCLCVCIKITDQDYIGRIPLLLRDRFPCNFSSIRWNYFYRPPTKLWKGNIFTGVCHSVHIGGVVVLLPEDRISLEGRIPPKTTLPLRDHTPSRAVLHAEPQKREVRIPLECFLVLRVHS